MYQTVLAELSSAMSRAEQNWYCQVNSPPGSVSVWFMAQGVSMLCLAVSYAKGTERSKAPS